MFSFGYSFFLSGPIIGYTSLSYFYIFSIVFYMIHYFDTIAKHPFLVALQMHPYQCSSLQYPPRIDKPAPSLIHLPEIRAGGFAMSFFSTDTPGRCARTSCCGSLRPIPIPGGMWSAATVCCARMPGASGPALRATLRVFPMW